MSGAKSGRVAKKNRAAARSASGTGGRERKAGQHAAAEKKAAPPLKGPNTFYHDVTLRPLVNQFSKEAFGRELSPKEWAAIVGARNGATVNIAGRGNSVQITTFSREFNSVRTISLRGGKLHIHNDLFTTPRTGTGLGTKIFRAQVRAAARAGVSEYSTSAARTNTLNGYYTWARLGYNAPVPAAVRSRLPASLKGAKTVNDLMRSAEGRAAWKQYGVTTSMTFDLSRGSLSRQTLAAYVREQRAKTPR